MKTILLLVYFFCLTTNFAQDKSSSNNSLSKNTIDNYYDYIAINQMKMWIYNNGISSHDPNTDAWGLLWPGGQNASLNLSYAEGLIWAGYAGNKLHVSSNIYHYGLQPGKILNNGLPDDPASNKYKIYKIRKDWEKMPFGPTRDKYQNDYEAWPGDEGAPFYDFDNNGIYTPMIDKPLLLGDEVLWCVMNDMDTNRTLLSWDISPSAISEGSYPIEMIEEFKGYLPVGLEVQLTVYGFTHSSLKDVLFKDYKIINKSGNTIDSIFFGYYADIDLGFRNDDFVGCDTLLNLAYGYNSDNNDEGYFNLNPPAIGYKLLQGPIIKSNLQQDSARQNHKWLSGFSNLPMTSFNIGYSDPYWNYPFDILPKYVYNWLNGLLLDGNAIINPIDSMSTKYPFSGNPVDSAGWYMGYQNKMPLGDYRIFLNTGPVMIAPKDTQEVVIAVIAAQGSNNLTGINELKKTANTVQYFYDHYFPEISNASYTPPLPKYYYLSQNFPNPFNSTTTIEYELPIEGYTTLIVYDILGREIITPVNEIKAAGYYKTNIDASNFTSGVYFYSLTSKSFIRTKKMIVIK